MGLNFFSNIKKEILDMNDELFEDLEENEYIYDDEENNNALVTFFARGPYLKNDSKEDILNIFNKAYEEDEYKSIQTLFYIRDKYNGLGEREVFKTILHDLGLRNNKYIKKNINLIPCYGRYDDLYALFDTPLEKDVIEFIKMTLEEDKNKEKPSTLCKWLKSENASSSKTKQLAKKTRKLLNLTSKEYRLLLSGLRKKLNLTESILSSKEYDDILYGELSTNNLKRYKKAFLKHDEINFKTYLNIINSQNPKSYKNSIINNNTPYSIIKKLNEGNDTDIKKYEEEWNSLPNYLGEYTGDTVVSLGFSGNNKDAINAGVSTALYLLNYNKGRYKNYIATMKPNPNLKRIKASGIKERINEIVSLSISDNINVEAILDLILFAAIKNGLTNEDIPSRLFFIGDEDCIISLLLEDKSKRTPFYIDSETYESIIEKWERANLRMPSLTFWIINKESETSKIVMDKNAFIFAFGYSDDVFKSILKDEYISTKDLMDSIFNDKRYLNIKNI